MSGITAIVITYNEAANIAVCLESVKWCNEIIVVDSKSNDNTREIASKFTKKIITVENLTYGEKRNIGIENAIHEWIIWLDADERVSIELKKDLEKLIWQDKTAFDAYYINRKSFFINKFINHSGWYPDYTLRFFKKSTDIRFNSALVHEKAIYTGKTGKIKHNILHYTDKNYEHYINKLNKYTTLSSEELFSIGKKASFFDIIFRPAFTFFKMYFLKLGIMDGFTGLILCTLSSVHVMTKYSKLYLLNNINKQ